jgi:hypothetical protein
LAPGFYTYYLLPFLKQSMHFKLLVSRGVKGRDVMAAPQLAHCQLPEDFERSVVTGTVVPPKPSSVEGSPAKPASKGMSGTSIAVDISGVCWALLSLCLP